MAIYNIYMARKDIDPPKLVISKGPETTGH